MPNPKTTKAREHSVYYLLTDWRILLYNCAIVLFSAYLLLTKLRRYFSKKKASEFLRQRWTIPVYGGEKDNPDALHVVFVAMGLGEKRTADQLSTALKTAFPNVRTTWVVKGEVTVESIRKADQFQAVTYIPFDFFPPVATWVKMLRPDIVVSVQKLWIPNIVWGARLSGAGVCVVSGQDERYKKKKFNIWDSINRWTLQAYDVIGLLSEKEEKKLNHLLSPSADVRVTGMAKFSQPVCERPIPDGLEEWIKTHNQEGAPLLAAGSLHQGEEEFIVEAFEKVRETIPSILLLAPRHLNRVDPILELLHKRGLSVSQRSKFASSTANTSHVDVLLLDSIGELASAYSFAQAAYVGGTLKAPGHNIFEPLEWGVPVYFGPGDGNVPPTQQIAIKADVGFRIHSPLELADQWKTILQDQELRSTLRKRCDLVIAQQEESLKNNLQIILDTIEAHSKRQS